MLTGVFIFFSHGYLVVLLYRRDQFMDVSPDEVLLWPVCVLNFAAATFMISVALIDWRGNPSRVLLLRLLDAKQGEKSDDEPTA